MAQRQAQETICTLRGLCLIGPPRVNAVTLHVEVDFLNQWRGPWPLGHEA